jgi:hypothetical protein
MITDTKTPKEMLSLTNSLEFNGEVGMAQRDVSLDQILKLPSELCN